MKKNIYLMRHGETLFNVKKLKQGFCDSPLTNEGIKQAQAAGKWFKKNNISFDEGYTSELNRTKNTIKKVAPNLNFKSFIELNEWNFGSAEGDLAAQHAHIKFPFGNYFVELGGENHEQVKTRTNFIMNKIAEISSGENILVVSHGRILREFSNLHLPSKKVERPKNLFNCIIFKFEYQTIDKTWEFVDIIKTDTN